MSLPLFVLGFELKCGFNKKKKLKNVTHFSKIEWLPDKPAHGTQTFINSGFIGLLRC